MLFAHVETIWIQSFLKKTKNKTKTKLTSRPLFTGLRTWKCVQLLKKNIHQHNEYSGIHQIAQNFFLRIIIIIKIFLFSLKIINDYIKNSENSSNIG